MMLKLKPLSVNNIWKGRKIKTEEYKQFEKDFFYLLKKNYKGAKPKKYFKIKIVWFFKDSKSDIDNPLKPFMDCLKLAGIIKDDRFCLEMNIQKQKGDNIIYFEIDEL